MKKLLTVREVADLLGISRVAVFYKIKKGEIKAIKVGKAYVIDKDDITVVTDKQASETQKAVIDRAVEKTIDDYGETLKLLKDN